MVEQMHTHHEVDECVAALHQVHAFLHNELLEADADAIRHHLHACERCMEQYEIETAIEEMIRRAAVAKAPSSLHLKIRSMRIGREVS